MGNDGWRTGVQRRAEELDATSASIVVEEVVAARVRRHMIKCAILQDRIADRYGVDELSTPETRLLQSNMTALRRTAERLAQRLRHTLTLMSEQVEGV